MSTTVTMVGNASSPGDVYDFLFKIILIGDSGVGKSSILNRYTRNEFQLESKTTIGVELASSLMNIDNKIIKISVWDTAGQERFRAASNLYYRNTLGAFIVFDITNDESFRNVQKWLNELKDFVNGDCVITLVGNKYDLRHLRAVATDEAKSYADMHGMHYIETSALDSINIEPAFTGLIQNIYLKAYKSNCEMNDAKKSANNQLTQHAPITVTKINQEEMDKQKSRCCSTV